MEKAGRIAAVLLGIAASAWPAGHEAGGARVPVLLELFTSEGCSSCPPADKLLETLDRSQPVAGVELVVLSEHVDYWNQLGWKDRFSSARFTARQADYAEKFHLDGPYTPQLVVDGRTQLVGGDARQTLSAVRRAIEDSKIPIAIQDVERNGNQVTARVQVAAAAGKPLRLLVALADEKAESRVLRGENAGRSLAHVAVLRTLRDLGVIHPDEPVSREIALPVEPGSGANGLRLIVFLQDPGLGRVEGVALRKF